MRSAKNAKNANKCPHSKMHNPKMQNAQESKNTATQKMQHKNNAKCNKKNERCKNVKTKKSATIQKHKNEIHKKQFFGTYVKMRFVSSLCRCCHHFADFVFNLYKQQMEKNSFVENEKMQKSKNSNPKRQKMQTYSQRRIVVSTISHSLCVGGLLLLFIVALLS